MTQYQQIPEDALLIRKSFKGELYSSFIRDPNNNELKNEAIGYILPEDVRPLVEAVLEPPHNACIVVHYGTDDTVHSTWWYSKYNMQWRRSSDVDDLRALKFHDFATLSAWLKRNIADAVITVVVP